MLKLAVKIFASVTNLLKNPKGLLKVLFSLKTLMKSRVASKTELLKNSKDDLEFLFSLMSSNEEKMKISRVALTTNLLRKPLGFSWMPLLILGDEVMMTLLKHPPES